MPTLDHHRLNSPLRAHAVRRSLLLSGWIVLALVLLAREGASMPPPAPGNTKGLPASVREQLRQNPELFYPKKGFRHVIQRQKDERRATGRRD